MKLTLVGFRKLSFGILFFLVSLILLATGAVTGADWIKYNAGVVTAFFATNVGEHLLEVGKTWATGFVKKQDNQLLEKIK